jgi:hypothetical protein
MKTIIMIKMSDSFDLRFLSISVIIRSKVLNYKQGLLSNGMKLKK